MTDTRTEHKHHNDIYGDLSKTETKDTPAAIPAATVVLIRDQPGGLEVLMLKKNSKISFGGMWVFPGGRIDEEDYPENRDPLTAARQAAARETREEAGIATSAEDFIWFSHWTPPASTAKRFSTWFFAAQIAPDQIISIDGGEIMQHNWMNPADALDQHTAGKIDLVPPTWITLYQLSLYRSADKLLDVIGNRPVKVYETRVHVRKDGIRVAKWQGDSGYMSKDPDAPGNRHRLVMHPDGFKFENSVETY